MTRQPCIAASLALCAIRSPSALNPQEIFTTPELQHSTERFDYVLRLGAIGVLTDGVGAGKSTGLRFAASRLHPSKYCPLWITALASS